MNKVLKLGGKVKLLTHYMDEKKDSTDTLLARLDDISNGAEWEQ
jgi:hypothetical protein